MAETIVALYKDEVTAERAHQDLLRSGFSDPHIRVVSQSVIAGVQTGKAPYKRYSESIKEFGLAG